MESEANPKNYPVIYIFTFSERTIQTYLWFPYLPNASSIMDPLSERLKKQRESLGITIAQLAERTKVRQQYIHAIEQGMYTMLPQVYVRSFIKTIGSALGISSSEVQRLITAVLDNPSSTATSSGNSTQTWGVSSESSPSESLERTADSVTKLISQSTSGIQSVYVDLFRKKSRFFSRRRLLVAAILTTVGVVTYLAFFNSSHLVTSIPPSGVVVISEDSLTLSATVTDTSEFTITIDNQRNEKVLLVPTEEYTWSASEKFVINNIFNAGGIRFVLNSNPLPRYGNANEVLRELTITRKEVIASNAPVAQHSAAVASGADTSSKAHGPRPLTLSKDSTTKRSRLQSGKREAPQDATQRVITRTKKRVFGR